MESRDGEERPTSEHGEDKDHGLWPQSGKGPVASVRQV